MKIKKLTETAIIPTRGSEDAAGYDLYADNVEGDVIMADPDSWEIVGAGKVRVHTGIAMEIPKGYVGLLFARSGIACKRNLRPSNCVGVIDSDYRGEIIVSLYNDVDASRVCDGQPIENSTQVIVNGERVAQIVIMPYIAPELEVVDELDETGRGTGGFGSTGTK